MWKKKGVSEDYNVFAQLLTSAVPSWPSSEPHAVIIHTHTHTHTHSQQPIHQTNMFRCVPADLQSKNYST